MAIDTRVHVSEDVKFGQFANAFRVMEEIGPDCFLDFIVYSADAQQATVVSRIRVRREFLPNIRETLSEAMTELLDEDGASEPLEPIQRKNGERVH